LSPTATFGYTLSSEEFGPDELVAQAEMAEAAGFEFLTVSDHFHPWTETQGHSPFAWTTIGAALARTRKVMVGTGVTCPIIRYHPAIVAQAAATCSALGGGRFFLGVGTGEWLNEHITGEHWPAVPARREMLAESVDVMRALWTGETVDHRGRYYTLENAQLFTRPAGEIEVIAAARGEDSARFVAGFADGLWSTSPAAEVVKAYREAGGRGPAYGQITVCVADDEAQARSTALRVWPTAGIPGQLSSDLPTWTHFEQVSKLVTEARIAERIVCGNDAGRVLATVDDYLSAGFDHLHFHQVGPDQQRFFRFWDEELRPRLPG
jgi:G6PDH family F420-dependent oxidoreductase